MQSINALNTINIVNLTIEQYIESFPNSTFFKQEGEPKYEKIKIINKLAAENAASIDTIRGGMQHGYLAIILDSNTYHTLIGEIFIASTNLGLVPIIAGITRAAIVAT